MISKEWKVEILLSCERHKKDLITGTWGVTDICHGTDEMCILEVPSCCCALGALIRDLEICEDYWVRPMRYLRALFDVGPNVVAAFTWGFDGEYDHGIHTDEQQDAYEFGQMVRERYIDA